jgi:hypothetical protein
MLVDRGLERAAATGQGYIPAESVGVPFNSGVGFFGSVPGSVPGSLRPGQQFGRSPTG